MQCPNCGKEALNVNGRFVCLDCGVEISTTGTPIVQTQTNPTPVVNHSQTSQTQEEIITPATVAVDNNIPTQVVEPTVNVPTSGQTQPTPTIPTPEEFVPTETPHLEPNKNETSVRDYYLESLNKMSGEENKVSDETQVSNVPPDFPEPDQTSATVPSQPQTSETTIPSPVTATEPLLADQAMTENLNSPVISETPQPAESQPSPTINENIGTIPDEPQYFQPSSVKITPQENENITSEQFDQLSTPVGIGAGEPVLSDIPPKPAEDEGLWPKDSTPTTTVETTQSPEISENPQATTPSDVAIESPSEPTIIMPPEEPAPVFKERQDSDNLPGIGNIPSAESVFGPDNTTDNSDPSDIVMKKGLDFKKIALIFLGIILALAIIGGLIYGGLILFKPKSTDSSNGINSGEVLNISGSVGDKMDNTTNLSNNFTQNVDYTGLTVAELSDNPQKKADLALFFSKIVESKGIWRLDAENDVSFEGQNLSKDDKRVYIKSENSTLVYSPDTQSWVAVSGLQINLIPPFFPIESKGSLFYASRNENIVSAGEEEFEGVSYKKYIITPKQSFVEEILTLTNPTLFEGIKIESLNSENLNVVAYVDDENRIYKVKVDGTIELKSNYASGSIKIDATGVYNYDSLNVVKP